MAATVVCASPVFLVGALAVQMRQSLHFSVGELGMVAAVYYLGAGMSSMALGHLAEAIGGLRTMRLASVVSGVSLLLVATAVRSVLALALVMVPAGVASAAMQPAANLFLARRVPEERQGLAFGLKQSAVPIAALLGGLAVPTVGLTVGWQWAFAIVALLAAITAITLPRPRQSLAERRAVRHEAAPSRVGLGPLVVLTVAFGLGVGAASALAAFLASSAVVGGLGRGDAGLLVALGGATAAASRIINGRLADRRGRAHLTVVAAMLLLGAGGYGALALVTARHLASWYFPTVVVVFAAGWGWNGLFNFAVVKNHPDHPGLATGLAQTGGRFGGMLGPFAFGLIVAHGSYPLAWLSSAAAALGAAALMLVGRRSLLRNRARETRSPGG